MRWGCPCGSVLSCCGCLYGQRTASGQAARAACAARAALRRGNLRSPSLRTWRSNGCSSRRHDGRIGSAARPWGVSSLSSCCFLWHADGCTVSPTSLTRVSDAPPFSRVFGGTTCSRVSPSISGRLISELAVRSLQRSATARAQRGGCARSLGVLRLQRALALSGSFQRWSAHLAMASWLLGRYAFTASGGLQFGHGVDPFVAPYMDSGRL